MPIKDRRQELTHAVAVAQAELSEHIAALQSECVHPIAHVDIVEGAVRSRDNQEIYLRCKLCGWSSRRNVRLNYD